jgi:hypothetical protein
MLDQRLTELFPLVFTFSFPDIFALDEVGNLKFVTWLPLEYLFSDRLLSSFRPSVCKLLCFGFFSTTTWPILIRLGTNYPWVEGIQVCSNEGDNLSSRGDNSERVKIH